MRGGQPGSGSHIQVNHFQTTKLYQEIRERTETATAKCGLRLTMRLCMRVFWRFIETFFNKLQRYGAHFSVYFHLLLGCIYTRVRRPPVIWPWSHARVGGIRQVTDVYRRRKVATCPAI